MAKRRRLVAPDTSELDKIEEGFAAKPQVNPFAAGQTSVPPIAKVAADAAEAHALSTMTDRVEAARDKADAEKWRLADGAGRTVQMIPIAEIDRGYLRRDRMGLDPEELEELIASIRVNGLRSPIEVVPLDDGYGLISGFRRLEACSRLGEGFEQIPAFVRTGQEGADAYVSMIEENELRSDLTPYERGRIAVLVAGQGVFPNVEDAVDTLFAAASRAKRSKVRSFAAVHEALGDMLCYPSQLSERLGLKLATALRSGGQGTIRGALAALVPETPKEEADVLERALRSLSEPEKDVARGGRPKEVTKLDARALARGGLVTGEISPQGVRIDLKDCELSTEEAEALLEVIRNHLG